MEDGWRVQCVKLARHGWTLLACRRRGRRCVECLLLVVYCVCVYTVWNVVSFPPVDLAPAADSSPPQRAAAADDVTEADVIAPRRRDVMAHVTWFYPPRTPLRFHEAMCLLAVQRYVRPRKILLWYDAASTPPAGPWWQFARQAVAHLLPVPAQFPLRSSTPAGNIPGTATARDFQYCGQQFFDAALVVLRAPASGPPPATDGREFTRA